MEFRNVHNLKPHPENDRIYGDRASQDLIDSVKKFGFWEHEPLLITADNIIVSGHRRWDAARIAGLNQVPVMVFESDDELDIREMVVRSNKENRDKTNEQRGREAKVLLEIERERAVKRKSLLARNNTLQASTVTNPDVEPVKKGESAQIVGEQLGVSKNYVNQSVRVVEAIDTLEERGRKREADQLRTTMNRSVKAAYNAAKDEGYIQVEQRNTPPPSVKVEQVQAPSKPQQVYISLTDWKQYGSNEHNELLTPQMESTAKFNWQDTNNIEWAYWSWNPVTGCKHNCPYCYARDIANRFYDVKFEPALWHERLTAPYNMKLPAQAETDIGYKNVFTCSMADLFGRWVPSEWIEAVLQVIRDTPQWNYLLLTKFPIRLAEFDFPDNAWVGTTVDCQARVANAEKAFSRVNAKVKWLSCEPMLEPLRFSSLDMFSWVVIGGSTKSTQTPGWVPPRRWVVELEYQAYQAGCMVYEKSNLHGERLREYPGNHTNQQIVLPEQLRYLAEVE